MSQTPESLFQRLRGKARNGILIEGIGLGLAIFVIFVAVSFALDRTLRLEMVYRACLLALAVFALWSGLRRSIFKPIQFELTDDELALAVERGENLDQSLISAVQFERVIAKGDTTTESTELMKHVVSDVRGRIDRIRNRSALDVGRVRKFAAIALVCAGALGTWAALDQSSLLLWAKRNLFMSNEDWPRNSALRFTTDDDSGTVRVPEGNDLTIEVLATGVIPDEVFLEYEFPDGTEGREPMALTGGADDPTAEKRFTWLMESVITNAKVRVYGGDAAEQELEIVLVKRPALSEVKITQTFPAYMKEEPTEVNTAEGDLRMPAGVTLDFVGRSSKGLENAYLMFGQDQKVPLTVDEGGTTFRGTFSPEKSGVLTLDVTDTDGLGANRPPKLFLRVMKDSAPNVDYKTNGIGSMILFKALIPGTLRVRDDFGLTKVASKIRISRGMGQEADPGAEPGKKPPEPEWETVPFDQLRQPSTEENEVDYEQAVVFDLLTRNDKDLDPMDPKNPIRPGMMISIQFDATDNFGPGEPHLGQSEVLTLRVVEQEKLMQDLNRRQLERRRELTQILEKEKSYKDEIAEIVSPTSADSRAKLGRLRLKAISRDQLALQKQLIGVAQRYAQILDEYFNNRILQPSEIQSQRQAIQFPLEKLSQDNFPTSAQEVADFAHGGLEDQRTIAVGSYDTIIRILQRVISNMKHLESVAGVIEDLRRIRELQRGVEKSSRKALDKEDAGAKDVPVPDKDKKDNKDGGK